MSTTTIMSEKIPSDCDICCETFTNIKRKRITCKKCDLHACIGCVKNYLLSKKEPHCMKCKMAWTDNYCEEMLGSFMHKDYRKYQKDLLWEMQKARMPETMPAVEREVKIRGMRNELRGMKERINELGKLMEDMIYDARVLERNINLGNVDGSTVEEMEKKKREFIRACPMNNCNGFLSSQWKCGVCEVYVCKECFEVIGKDKDAEHTCDPNTLASAKLLKKETKPCPSCSAAIYKISGCDQMWCTQC